MVLKLKPMASTYRKACCDSVQVLVFKLNGHDIRSTLNELGSKIDPAQIILLGAGRPRRPGASGEVASEPEPATSQLPSALNHRASYPIRVSLHLKSSAGAASAPGPGRPAAGGPRRIQFRKPLVQVRPRHGRGH
jgi:hypothetical protein